MKDGRLNKCKDCAKNDVRLKYEENIGDNEYVNKERARCREKYKRLNYKDKCVVNKYGTNCVSRFFKSRGYVFENKELHHWNYDKVHDVFVLSRRLHSRIHKKLELDEELMIFTINGVLLDTKEKHYNFIINFMKENGIVEDIINLEINE